MNTPPPYSQLEPKMCIIYYAYFSHVLAVELDNQYRGLAGVNLVLIDFRLIYQRVALIFMIVYEAAGSLSVVNQMGAQGEY